MSGHRHRCRLSTNISGIVMPTKITVRASKLLGESYSPLKSLFSKYGAIAITRVSMKTFTCSVFGHVSLPATTSLSDTFRFRYWHLYVLRPPVNVYKHQPTSSTTPQNQPCSRRSPVVSNHWCLDDNRKASMSHPSLASSRSPYLPRCHPAANP